MSMYASSLFMDDTYDPGFNDSPAIAILMLVTLFILIGASLQ